MHLAFTEEQEELRSAVRSVLAKECPASLPRSIVEGTGDADGLRARMVGLDWPALTARLIESGDPGVIAEFAQAAPESPLAAARERIDEAFDAREVLWHGQDASRARRDAERAVRA